MLADGGSTCEAEPGSESSLVDRLVEQQRTDPPSTTRGTSLIEVMIASAILIVVLSSSAMAISFGVQQVGRSRRTADAERIAASHLEQLLIENRGRDIARSGTVVFAADGRVDGSGPYRSSWTVERRRPIPIGARLQVTVSWVDGGARKIGLATYLAPPLPPPLPEPTEDELRGFP